MGKKYTYTAEMDNYIRDHYPNRLAIEIANELGVSLSSLYNRTAGLRIYKSDEFKREQGRISSNHPKAIATRLKNFINFILVYFLVQMRVFKFRSSTIPVSNIRNRIFSSIKL